MKKNSISYSYIIKEYINDFVRDFSIKRFLLLSYILIGVSYILLFDIKINLIKCIPGIPVIFSILSGAFHMVSLPMMMYLVPYSKSQREEYIQKMLYVKIAVPTIFAIIIDIILLIVNAVSVYAVVLQLVTVLTISYVTGTLNDGTIETNVKKSAYGDIMDFVGIPLIICYMFGTVMAIICTDSINGTEFLVTLTIELSACLIMVNVIRKRWKTIRANFADYEKMKQTEERQCR